MTDHTRAHPACPDASNPFHQCAEYCAKKIAESGKTKKDKKGSLSFGRRKKKGSESQPVSPQLNGNFQLHYVNKKKAGEQYGGHSCSRTPSDEISSRDSSFNKMTYESSTQVVPVSGNLKPDQPKEPSDNIENHAANGFPTKQEESTEIHSSPTRHKDVEGNKSPIIEPKSFISSVAVQAKEGSDDDADSIISDADDRVWVGNNHVKSCVSSTLKSVFDKHGDITAKCQLESLSLRAYFLESVCFVIQELQSTPFKYLTKSKVKEMLAILKDVESAQINVSWLRHVLNQVAEALDLVGQQCVAEVTKANSDRDLENTKKELELATELLAQKEKEVADARAKLEETKSRLTEIEQKSTQLEEHMLSLTPMVEKINCKVLLDGIL